MRYSSVKKRIGAFKFYALLTLLLAIGVVSGYSMKSWLDERDEQQLLTLQHSLGNLKTENDKLVKQLNILGIELEVARLANEKSQQMIQDELEGKVALKRELSFYQKVMAPELDQEGFVINSFDVFDTLSENYFRYALVLMQHDKHRDTVKGNITITISGSKKGAPAQYDLKALLANPSENIAFNFRYFEVLKGEFKLPEGFIPEKVQVNSVLSEAKWGKRNLKRSFDWQIAGANLASVNT